MPKTPEQWWSDTIRDRCADHEKMMQHCVKSAVAEALADTMRVVEMAEKALSDAQGGLDYVRRNHGDLYGVGLDRCEEGSRNALAAIAKLKEKAK